MFLFLTRHLLSSKQLKMQKLQKHKYQNDVINQIYLEQERKIIAPLVREIISQHTGIFQNPILEGQQLQIKLISILATKIGKRRFAFMSTDPNHSVRRRKKNRNLQWTKREKNRRKRRRENKKNKKNKMKNEDEKKKEGKKRFKSGYVCKMKKKNKELCM